MCWCFCCLQTHGAGVVVLQTVTNTPGRRPDTPQQDRPQEELTLLGGALTLLSSFAPSMLHALAEEEGAVGGGGRVLLICAPLPNESIFSFIIEVNEL
jgi:hypothetical protein